MFRKTADAFVECQQSVLLLLYVVAFFIGSYQCVTAADKRIQEANEIVNKEKRPTDIHIVSINVKVSTRKRRRKRKEKADMARD